MAVFALHAGEAVVQNSTIEIPVNPEPLDPSSSGNTGNIFKDRSEKIIHTIGIYNDDKMVVK